MVRLWDDAGVGEGKGRCAGKLQGLTPCRGTKARYIWLVSFATGVTLKQLTIVAWALAVWAFTFSFNFNLNMDVSMIAHVDMFGVAAGAVEPGWHATIDAAMACVG
jgi:hypothetical protein